VNFLFVFGVGGGLFIIAVSGFGVFGGLFLLLCFGVGFVFPLLDCDGIPHGMAR
jgi:hypothetical protein